MDKTKIKGSCLCGEVRYEYFGKTKVFQYCHCTRCQKFTGSAHASNIIIDPAQFKWTKGETSVGRFELPEAKHYATAFCKNCGSSLPWLTKSEKAVVIPAGKLDENPDIKPIHNIFLKDKASWYEDPEKILKYEKLPIKEKKRNPTYAAFST